MTTEMAALAVTSTEPEDNALIVERMPRWTRERNGRLLVFLNS